MNEPNQQGFEGEEEPNEHEEAHRVGCGLTGDVKQASRAQNLLDICERGASRRAGRQNRAQKHNLSDGWENQVRLPAWLPTSVPMMPALSQDPFIRWMADSFI